LNDELKDKAKASCDERDALVAQISDLKKRKRGDSVTAPTNGEQRRKVPDETFKVFKKFDNKVLSKDKNYNLLLVQMSLSQGENKALIENLKEKQKVQFKYAMKMILSAREVIDDSAAGDISLDDADNLNDDDPRCHELEINATCLYSNDNIHSIGSPIMPSDYSLHSTESELLYTERRVSNTQNGSFKESPLSLKLKS